MRARRAGTSPGSLAVACVLLGVALLPARAGEDFTLPFLLADGADRGPHPVAPVFLPAWSHALPGDFDLDPRDESPSLPYVHEDVGDTGLAFPDVSSLLQDMPGTVQTEGGMVLFAGDEAEQARLERLIAAVHAGFERRVRIEVEVRWGRSDEPLARLTGEAPLGTLLVADGREERAYPVELQLGPSATYAAMEHLQVGPLVVASAVAAGDLLVLRLAVHTSHVVEDVRFEGDHLTLIAPTLSFSALVAEAPATPGRDDTIRCGDLRIRYRVEAIPSRAPPPGIRVFSEDALTPLFAWDRLPAPGSLVSRFEETTSDLPPHASPGRLPDTDAGVARYQVPPGLVLLEGAAEALDRASAPLEHMLGERRTPVRLALVTHGGLPIDMPVVRPASVAFVSGRLDPVVRTMHVEVADSVAQAGSVLAELFTGHALEITFDDPAGPRLTEAHAPLASVRPTVVPIEIRKQGRVVTERIPASRWEHTTSRTSRVLAPTELQVWPGDR